MREFKNKDFPEYLKVNWNNAECGKAIFLGKNVFLDPHGNLLEKEIDEFKEVARNSGVVLTMRREFKTIGDTPTLIGFWFYVVALTPAHESKKKKDHSFNCTNSIITIFKNENEPIRLQDVLKNYGLEYSERKIRASLAHLKSIGFLKTKRIDGKQGHTGRPTIEYIKTQLLTDYNQYDTVINQYKD